MTNLEAIDAVEQTLTNLKLKTKDGEHLKGIEAIGFLHKYFPLELEDLEARFFIERTIIPAQYFSGICDLVTKAKKEHLIEKSRLLFGVGKRDVILPSFENFELDL